MSVQKGAREESKKPVAEIIPPDQQTAQGKGRLSKWFYVGSCTDVIEFNRMTGYKFRRHANSRTTRYFMCESCKECGSPCDAELKFIQNDPDVDEFEVWRAGAHTTDLETVNSMGCGAGSDVVEAKKRGRPAKGSKAGMSSSQLRGSDRDEEMSDGDRDEDKTEDEEAAGDGNGDSASQVKNEDGEKSGEAVRVKRRGRPPGAVGLKKRRIMKISGGTGNVTSLIAGREKRVSRQTSRFQSASPAQAVIGALPRAPLGVNDASSRRAKMGKDERGSLDGEPREWGSAVVAEWLKGQEEPMLKNLGDHFDQESVDGKMLLSLEVNDMMSLGLSYGERYHLRKALSKLAKGDEKEGEGAGEEGDEKKRDALELEGLLARAAALMKKIRD